MGPVDDLKTLPSSKKRPENGMVNGWSEDEVFFGWLRGRATFLRCEGLVLGSVTCQRGYTIDIHLK